MNLVQRIAQILTERVVAVVGSLFASQVESLVALQQAEQLDELEERARQFNSPANPTSRPCCELGPNGSIRTILASSDNPLSVTWRRKQQTPTCPCWKQPWPQKTDRRLRRRRMLLTARSVRGVFGDLWTGRKRTTRSGPSRHRDGRTTQRRRLGPCLVEHWRKWLRCMRHRFLELWLLVRKSRL